MTTLDLPRARKQRGRRGRPEKTPRYGWLITTAIAVGLVDRVDLLGGSGTFKLTPFLALAPVLVLVALNGLRRKPRTPPPPTSGTATLAIYVLGITVVASLFFGQEGLGISRALLLAVLVASSLSLVALIRWSGNYEAVRRGAWIGLFVYFGFDVYQQQIFNTYGLLGPTYQGLIDVTISPYGEGVVRLTGGATDANRGAMAIAFYTWLVVADPATSRTGKRGIRTDVFALLIGVGLVLVTLSRSGGLVFAVVIAAAALQLLRRLKPAQQVVTVVGILGAVVYLGVTRFGELFLDGQSLLAQRLSFTEGSSESHFVLIEKGFEQGTSDWRFFTGHGYGESYLYLQDIFAGNVYGNYHSLYMTLLVEIGILGLIAGTVLLFGALSRSRKLLALGLILFNVFYQGFSDPIFWIAIGFLWFLPDPTDREAALRGLRRSEREPARPPLPGRHAGADGRGHGSGVPRDPSAGVLGRRPVPQRRAPDVPEVLDRADCGPRRRRVWAAG